MNNKRTIRISLIIYIAFCILLVVFIQSFSVIYIILVLAFYIAIISFISFKSRIYFDEEYSYFYPQIFMGVVGIIIFYSVVLESQGWDGFGYLVFCIFDIIGIVLSIPIYYILKDKFRKDEQ